MNSMPNIDRAATMAYRCLVARRVTTLPVMPEELLHACRGTRVLSCGEAAQLMGWKQEWLAVLVGDADAWTYRYEMSDGTVQHIVCYRQGGNPARRRFSLAHELGHIVLRHMGGGSWEEEEADAFASHLLCPKPVLRRMLGTGMVCYVEQVAAGCYISVAAAQQVLRRPLARVDAELETAVDELLKDAIFLPPEDGKASRCWHPIVSWPMERRLTSEHFG